jgi:hypothetical protein
VDFIGFREVANPRDDLERAFTVGIQEDDVRLLHGHARDEHGLRYVDRCMPLRAQSLPDGPGLGGLVAQEYGGDGATSALIVEPISQRSPPVARPPLRPLLRETHPDPLPEAGQDTSTPNEREDEQHHRQLAASQRKHLAPIVSRPGHEVGPAAEARLARAHGLEYIEGRE